MIINLNRLNKDEKYIYQLYSSVLLHHCGGCINGINGCKCADRKAGGKKYSDRSWGFCGCFRLGSRVSPAKKPIVATEDKSIDPDLERRMYKRTGSIVSEIKGSHAIYISQPAAVAAVIERAANGLNK